MSWIDDIGQEGFFKGMAAAMKGDSTGPAPGGLTSKDAKTAEKSFKNLVDTIKETASGTKLWKESLNGNIQPMVDVTEQLKELDEAITNATSVEEIRAIEEKKANIVRAQTTTNMRITAANLATGFVKVTGTLIRGSLDYAKNLLEGMDGIRAATELAANRAKATGEGISLVGSMLTGATGLASMLPPVRLLRLGFIALTAVLGPLLEKFGEKASELAQEGIRLLGGQLEQTRNSFQKLTSTGVTFANGMGEMRAQAGRAGLRLKDFEEAIGSSTESLSSMGMGMAQATKRIGGISGELRKSNLGKELYNLGFGFKEQAELAAQTAANLNASGRLRSMSDAEVAKATAQYGKDLKVLQGITGEDAKKKMEEARMKSMEADLLAEAMAKGGPEAVEKLRNQLATLPEAAKKGYMEFVSSGGTAITDVATNVMMSQNPLLRKQFDTMYQTLGDGSKNASMAMDETNKLTAATAQYARDNNANYRAIATGARLTGDSTLQSLTDIQNGFILANQKITEASVTATRTTVEKAAKTQDTLTNSIERLDTATNKHAVQLEALVTKHLPGFAQHLIDTIKPIQHFIDMLNAASDQIAKDAADKAGDALDEKNRKSMHLGDKIAQSTAKGLENVAGLIPVIGDDLKKKAQESRRQKETEYAKKKEATINQNEANRAKMTTGQKVMSVASGAIEDVSSLIPFFGSFLADLAEKSRVEAEKKQLERRSPTTNLRGFSKGGISNRPAIFGEKGPEAAVPLPDGRTIPVTLKGIDKFFQATMKSLDPLGITDKNIKIPPGLRQEYESLFAKLAPTPAASQSQQSLAMASRLSGTMDLTSPGNTRKDEDRKAFNDDLKSMLGSQLAKQDEMIKALKDNISVNLRILAAAA